MERIVCSDVWRHARMENECCSSCHGDDGGPTDSVDFEMSGARGVPVYVEVCCAAYWAALARWGESSFEDGKPLPWLAE
jgi:hypothetical protein